MRKIFFALLLLAAMNRVLPAQTNQPLRLFIRAGVKTHGPGQHDHPRFLKEWTQLLNERGAIATGALEFPTPEQLAATDVLILSAGDAGTMTPAQRQILEQFLKRGGGLVVLHDGIASKDPAWYKTIVGGAWEYGKSKFFEGELSLYYLDRHHPITEGASNFDFDDEEYYDLDLMPDAHILAGAYQPDRRNTQEGRAFPSVYDVAPQMWTYEHDNYRAFVSVSGHQYKSYLLPHFRAVILRGIAWAGKRDANLFIKPEERASLLYPEGGPTAPNEAGKKIVLPPDFNLRLVAAEPLIEKPISLDWDAQGRLWVAETPEYPFRKDRSRPPFDRISILEDTRHDGVINRKSVFYDGLDLVTSMVFYRDGVIVSQAPYILWLRDTKGDGKADKKEILYSGFGTNDTHAVVNNLRWGLDGWIYATIGYTKGDIYSGDGKTHFGRISDGVIRFKPDGSAIEQVSSKSSNTWGVDVAPDGELFFSQANGNHIDHVVMPESALARGHAGKATSYLNIEDHHRSYPLMNWKQQAYVQIDWVGNFTAAAGCCIYDGGAWPEKYNYTAYVAEPTINLVHQDLIRPEGVSYRASKDADRQEVEFIRSSDLWFRPIHQRVGPDGALYILDFYNQAVVHNDTRGTRHDPQSNASIRPDRDHYFGRIWRVQHNDAIQFKIPNLKAATPAELVAALGHPNEWVRGTALRLLNERNQVDVSPQLMQLAQSASATPETRIHALWALSNLRAFSRNPMAAALLAANINDAEVKIQKAALQISAVLENTANQDSRVSEAILKQTASTNDRVRLEALLAAENLKLNVPEIESLLSNYPGDKNDWLQSAFLGVANQYPMEFISTAFQAKVPDQYAPLIRDLAARIGQSQNAQLAAQLVILSANAATRADGVRSAALESLAHELKPEIIPPENAELLSALRGLLHSTNDDLAMTAFPLVVRWDLQETLKPEVAAFVQQLMKKLKQENLADESRLKIVNSLLAVQQLDSTILPAVASLLGSTAGIELQRSIIDSLGHLAGEKAGLLITQAYTKIPSNLQEVALNQILKRPDWTKDFLDAVEASRINLSLLGPVGVNRLRTYNDPALAERANKIIDAIRGPETKEKDQLIAQFTPIVMQPGDAVRGKQLFSQNCAICHRFNGFGKDVAPDLTGMGAHGPAELIIHVLDPNREVEPNYYAYSIETKDGETYDGVIAGENKNSVTLRNAAGDVEIKIADIQTRRNTGLSLMPNGFESLGGENLRDILAYLCAGESRFRLLDMRSAFTANTAKGIWISDQTPQDSLEFKKFGVVKVGDVPFEIVSPQKSSTGKNVTVLKGGQGYDQTLAQKVEFSAGGAKAARIHFLGGIGGWAYPFGGEEGHKDLPVAKVTVSFSDHQTEEFILKNGVEFADWYSPVDVPESQFVPDLVTHGQVRYFAKTLKRPGQIESITLESFNNLVAPAFLAITLEILDDKEPLAKPPPAVKLHWKPGTKHVLMVGGGSSHDFDKWFNQADSATLSAVSGFSFNYTENPEVMAAALTNSDLDSKIDVLYFSSNQPLNDLQVRKAIFDFANAGHGLILIHPGLWYNWPDWPEYNRTLVGGGASSHDHYGEFEVQIKNSSHPVMTNVPPKFNVSDELYHFDRDVIGTPIDVLAEAKNLNDGKTYPSIWIVKHPQARIVCIALGHDAGAHKLAAFKIILQNSLQWVAENQ